MLWCNVYTQGTLRVLLVLLHDFPELLCEYHFGLCDCVPPSCIQMRNLLLSAFPRAMRLPDPFTLGLKVTRTSSSATAALPDGFSSAWLGGTGPTADVLPAGPAQATAAQALIIHQLQMYCGWNS